MIIDNQCLLMGLIAVTDLIIDKGLGLNSEKVQHFYAVCGKVE